MTVADFVDCVVWARTGVMRHQLGITVMTSSGNFDASTITVPALNTLAPAIREALASKAKAVRATSPCPMSGSSDASCTSCRCHRNC